MQAPLTDAPPALTIQLLEFIADRPRSHAEVLDAWQTTCPRLSIWEDACIDGLIDSDVETGKIVRVSEKGRQLLLAKRG